MGLGEDTCVVLALFNLCLLGCQSLGETLLRNKHDENHNFTRNKSRVIKLQILGHKNEIAYFSIKTR